MSGDYPRNTSEEVIAELGRRFREPGRERRLYGVLGTYVQLDHLLPRIHELCERNALSDTGNRVAFFSLNNALLEYLDQQGKMQMALSLADKLHNKELSRLMGEIWHLWLSTQTSANYGLVLCGFELFFSYLDSNALALVRQYAINGKHICMVMPGNERDHQTWAFDETPEYRRLVTGLVPDWTYILKD